MVVSVATRFTGSMVALLQWDTLSLLLVSLYLSTMVDTNKQEDDQQEEDAEVFKFLDNTVYQVVGLGNEKAVTAPLDALTLFDQRFPPPPLFPPPPPSLHDDTNALLREAIFNNIRQLIKRGIKGDTMDNSIPTGSTPGNHKGTGIILPTVMPCCGDSLSPESLDRTLTTSITTAAASTSTSSASNHQTPTTSPNEVIMKQGPPGPRGRRGKKGPKGPLGPEGPKGPEGPAGRAGSPGIPGRHGRDGHLGAQGIQGPPGGAGHDGSSGPRGRPGPPGIRGADGIPGLVIFNSAAAMYGVALEGLIAYRADAKQLYFRDHITWRAIRVTQCGDGLVDTDIGEECDDGNTDTSDSCVGCRSTTCGDGFLHLGVEECDQKNFGGNSCSSLRSGMVGRLHCTKKCTISYSRCRQPRR